MGEQQVKHRVPDIVRCAYAELIVTDLAASRRFWVDRLGFVVSASGPGVLYIRGHAEFVHHSLILRVGPVAACARFALRVRTPEDVDGAEELCGAYLAGGDTPERVYERAWAETVLQHAMERLGAEQKAGGNTEKFGLLRGFRTAD